MVAIRCIPWAGTTTDVGPTGGLPGIDIAEEVRASSNSCDPFLNNIVGKPANSSTYSVGSLERRWIASGLWSPPLPKS